MKLIAGLGNPGDTYTNTRHNVGFMCVDYFADQLESPAFTYNKKFDAETTNATVQAEKIILVKPQTYMNDSGRAIKEIIKYNNIEPKDIIIVHDDLDIEFGEFKIQTGKGPKGHNGIISVENHLGTVDFMRARIGVQSDVEYDSGKDFVLSRFTKEEMENLTRIFSDLYSLLSKSFK